MKFLSLVLLVLFQIELHANPLPRINNPSRAAGLSEPRTLVQVPALRSGARTAPSAPAGVGRIDLFGRMVNGQKLFWGITVNGAAIPEPRKSQIEAMILDIRDGKPAPGLIVTRGGEIFHNGDKIEFEWIYEKAGVGYELHSPADSAKFTAEFVKQALAVQPKSGYANLATYNNQTIYFGVMRGGAPINRGADEQQMQEYVYDLLQGVDVSALNMTNMGEVVWNNQLIELKFYSYDGSRAVLLGAKDQAYLDELFSKHSRETLVVQRGRGPAVAPSRGALAGTPPSASSPRSPGPSTGGPVAVAPSRPRGPSGTSTRPAAPARPTPVTEEPEWLPPVALAPTKPKTPLVVPSLGAKPEGVKPSTPSTTTVKPSDGEDLLPSIPGSGPAVAGSAGPQMSAYPIVLDTPTCHVYELVLEKEGEWSLYHKAKDGSKKLLLVAENIKTASCATNTIAFVAEKLWGKQDLEVKLSKTSNVAIDDAMQFTEKGLLYIVEDTTLRMIRRPSRGWYAKIQWARGATNSSVWRYRVWSLTQVGARYYDNYLIDIDLNGSNIYPIPIRPVDSKQAEFFMPTAEQLKPKAKPPAPPVPPPAGPSTSPSGPSSPTPTPEDPGKPKPTLDVSPPVSTPSEPSVPRVDPPSIEAPSTPRSPGPVPSIPRDDEDEDNFPKPVFQP